LRFVANVCPPRAITADNLSTHVYRILQKGPTISFRFSGVFVASFAFEDQCERKNVTRLIYG
jgi:hypothetical protein